jgi:hypothetical protein
MPRKETRYVGIMGDLHLLAVIMEANKEQFPEMEPFRLKLVGIVTQSQDVTAQQAALRAAKQEASQQLRRLLTEGQAVAHVCRTALKNRLGPRDERIVEFGLQPFRGRKTKAAAKTPATPPEAAGVAASTAPNE